MKRFLVLALMAGLSVVSMANSLGVAGQFNGFVYGSASIAGGESEGALGVGGSAAFGNPYQVAFRTGAGDLPTNATNVGLYVGGSLGTSSLNVGDLKIEGGRSGYVGGSVDASKVTIRPGGALNPLGSSVDASVFSSSKVALSQLSSALFALNSVSLVGAPQNINIDLAANAVNAALDPKLKVFSLDAGDLDQLGTINFNNFTGDETIVFNVTGTTVDWAMNVNNSATWSRVLWNFKDATTIKVEQRSLAGTILGVDATLTQKQNIDGTMIVDQYLVPQGYAPELHDYRFDGDLQAVPEPMTLSLVALVALWRRKKARKTA